MPVSVHSYNVCTVFSHVFVSQTSLVEYQEMLIASYHCIVEERRRSRNKVQEEWFRRGRVRNGFGGRIIFHRLQWIITQSCQECQIVRILSLKESVAWSCFYTT